MGLLYNPFAGRVSFDALGRAGHYDPPSGLPAAVEASPLDVNAKGIAELGPDFPELHARIFGRRGTLADQAERLFSGVGQGFCGAAQVAQMLVGSWPAGVLLGHGAAASQAALHAWNTAFLAAKGFGFGGGPDLPKAAQARASAVQDRLFEEDWKVRGQARGAPKPANDLVELVTASPPEFVEMYALDRSALVRNKEHAEDRLQEYEAVAASVEDPVARYRELVRRQGRASPVPWALRVECVYEMENEEFGMCLWVEVDPWSLLIVGSSAPASFERDLVFGQWAAHDDAVLTQRGSEDEWTSGTYERYIEQYTQVTQWGRDTKETRPPRPTVLELLARHPLREWAGPIAEEYMQSKALLLGHNRPPPRERVPDSPEG
ncbi:hypothetical protein Srot_2716 [Segniliparus rotundus DSM 44985]|uniref:Uncharacterized protein n=1 Tax=Segniliparus rotundus (strain ATCC BAA-972 / CDC 1076 / CIP 108378 / DSM 44985 / JCM 13578) TaxID=640132 RepID=D6ZCW3_SEGRD|nr:hypothetical protein [Segniliparus rotundus]ADG99150.1 hypothetical protein Srot_2716 [Segniliparus rotundus DSM 44985]